MPRMTILTEAELRKIVRLDLDAVACVEYAFHALATKAVAMPPIMRLDILEHRGEVDVKTAYVPGIDAFAIKISPGFFDNPKLGLPSVNGMMVLLSARTGLVEALLLDNGYLTDVRTAAAGAVAAKHLSRPDFGRRGDLRRRGAGGPAARGTDAGAADQGSAHLGPRRRQGGSDDGKAAREARHHRARRNRWRKGGCRRRHHRRHDTIGNADSESWMAAAWPARHRHGIRRGAQERTRPGGDRQGRTSMSPTA